MKNLVNIRNESGFGLIHVLAVTLIVSIAILGLFMSIEYARAQANANYHKRSALLIAQGYLEEIKYNNRNLGIYSRPAVRSRVENCTIEDRNTGDIRGQVTISTTGIPYGEEGYLNTYRDEVYVKITWKENPIANLASYMNPEQSIMIQENYYWKTGGVSGSGF